MLQSIEEASSLHDLDFMMNEGVNVPPFANPFIDNTETEVVISSAATTAAGENSIASPHDCSSNSNTSVEQHQHAEGAGGAQPVVTPTQPVAESGWGALLNHSTLVQLEDRNLVPDAIFVAVAQLKPCTFTMADKVGCYKTREAGFVGMCCRHCGGSPGQGRYFPETVRSLAQTTTSRSILKHVGSKCRLCPPHIKNTVQQLQHQLEAARGEGSVAGSSSSPGGRPAYGSRKTFFRRVWSRLHGGSVVGDKIAAGFDTNITAAAAATAATLVSNTNQPVDNNKDDTALPNASISQDQIQTIANNALTTEALAAAASDAAAIAAADLSAFTYNYIPDSDPSDVVGV